MKNIHFIEGHGGVKLCVREKGPKDAPAILLIHGWSQSSLVWQKQLDSDLAKNFRLVALDLRGHGQSDKPEDPELYQSSEIWAADIAAVIDQLALQNVLLLGWSMGGFFLGDYLRHQGDAAISGIAIVGGAVTAGTYVSKDVLAKRKINFTPALHEDLGISLPGIITFLKACSSAPMGKRDLAYFTGLNMLCPPYVRNAVFKRSVDNRDILGQFNKPALLIHGDAEKIVLVEQFEETKATLPSATTHLYPGVGHLPFWEEAARFNADLARFATSIFPKILPPEASAPATRETA